jgi:hypothetical protein
LIKETKNLDADAPAEYPAAPGAPPACIHCAASAIYEFPRGGGCFYDVHATTSASQLYQRFGTSLFLRATSIARRSVR